MENNVNLKNSKSEGLLEKMLPGLGLSSLGSIFLSPVAYGVAKGFGLDEDTAANICCYLGLGGFVGLIIGGLVVNGMMDQDEQKMMDSMSVEGLKEYMEKVYIPKHSFWKDYPR